MTIHELKTDKELYGSVVTDEKTFEVRLNDRNFQRGDELVLREYDPQTNTYSGAFVRRKITYVLKGGQFGIDHNYAVLGIQKI